MVIREYILQTLFWGCKIKTSNSEQFREASILFVNKVRFILKMDIQIPKQKTIGHVGKQPNPLLICVAVRFSLPTKNPQSYIPSLYSFAFSLHYPSHPHYKTNLSLSLTHTKHFETLPYFVFFIFPSSQVPLPNTIFLFLLCIQ